LTLSLSAPYDQVSLNTNGYRTLIQSLRIRIENLFSVRRSRVRRAATAQLPTEYGAFQIHVYESPHDRKTHVALVHGRIGDGEGVLARMHSSCLTGDVLHSVRCDCGQQLESAMQRIAAETRGVVLYLNQEGRGIGLANKIRAYALQDEGYDTVEANVRLGFQADERDYATGVAILRDLGVRSMRLLSNNPKKLAGITGYGLAVSELLPLEIPASDGTRRYLKTKKEKLGHVLSSV
jgi:3,4-dihydroxy 2-butanone 4-phosphate synthase/GTP cyclohydrolase II